METKEKIQGYIKNAVELYLPGAEASLFGSRARGDSDFDSDYDILVVTNEVLSPNEKFPLKTAIRKELLKFGIRSDVLIQSKSDLEVKRKLPGHIIKNILKEAVRL